MTNCEETGKRLYPLPFQLGPVELIFFSQLLALGQGLTDVLGHSLQVSHHLVMLHLEHECPMFTSKPEAWLLQSKALGFLPLKVILAKCEESVSNSNHCPIQKVYLNVDI